MKRKTTKLIKQIIESLKPYKPEKIILFGSYAWGKPKKDSDIDLLIIKQTKKDHYKRIPEARSYLHNIDQAFDILIMTPEEITKRLKLGDFFIKEILKRGRVLYEAK
jgi:predicted nucleotidyltransferase